MKAARESAGNVQRFMNSMKILMIFMREIPRKNQTAQKHHSSTYL
jgi:hypothetical protein